MKPDLQLPSSAALEALADGIQSAFWQFVGVREIILSEGIEPASKGLLEK